MCIFCDIIEHKIPSKIIYEDDNILSILDISQTSKGHTLVMPKKHYANFLEMPNDEYCTLMSKVQEIALKITENLNADGCNILINTNEVAGQTVMHTHVHIIPRYLNDDGPKIEFKSHELNLENIQKEILK